MRARMENWRAEVAGGGPAGERSGSGWLLGRSEVVVTQTVGDPRQPRG